MLITFCKGTSLWVQFSILISLHSFFMCCSTAQDVTDGSQYFVLLMITDGVISDMVQTKEAVVNVRLFECKCKTKIMYSNGKRRIC